MCKCVCALITLCKEEVELAEECEKTYNPYFSDDKVQAHVFVRVALKEMLVEEDVTGKVILLGCDNCKYQYKCTTHFDYCQKIAEAFQTTVVRLFSIHGHGN